MASREYAQRATAAGLQNSDLVSIEWSTQPR